MNQFEYEDYFDDIYLSSIKRKPPIIKSILLNFYGFFVCLWQKIVKEHIITEMSVENVRLFSFTAIRR